MRRGSGLKVGKVYRLRFPGIAARIIEPPSNIRTGKYPYLVESLILRSRWWVNELGEPDTVYSPRLIVATSDDGAKPSGCRFSQLKGFRRTVLRRPG